MWLIMNRLLLGRFKANWGKIKETKKKGEKVHSQKHKIADDVELAYPSARGHIFTFYFTGAELLFHE